MRNWFAKLPQYRNTSLFIALGNPVLEFAADFNSRAEFFWSHGLISDSTYKLFTSTCNYSLYVSEYYRGTVSSTRSRVMSLQVTETVDMCVEDETISYLNMQDVQDALHARLVESTDGLFAA
ncbi:hypothetical protein U1Q18_016437, partial [Sarracenia purpurea var. burkii]